MAENLISISKPLVIKLNIYGIDKITNYRFSVTNMICDPCIYNQFTYIENDFKLSELLYMFRWLMR